MNIRCRRRGRQLAADIVLAVFVAAWWFTPGFAASTDAAVSATLEEVVVTAERRETTLQKTPQAISVVSADELTRDVITDARTLLNTVPGLSLSQTSANTNLGLRGLASGGGNIFTDTAMAFNVNGVVLARPFGAAAAFYDVARIEVLKGPQGTLYGRNATVGAVNVVPNRPTQSWEGLAGLLAGNYGQFNAFGMVNASLSPAAAVRFAFQTAQHDGYLSNGLNDAKNQSARVGLQLEPASNLSLYLSADYFHDGSRGASTIYLYPNGFAGSRYQNPRDPWETLVPPPCATPTLCPTFSSTALAPPTVAAIGAVPVIGADSYDDNTTILYLAEINWRFKAATLTIEPAHVGTHVDFLNYGQGFQQRQQYHIGQDSFEARLASTSTTPWQWLVGGYYFHESQRGASDFIGARYYADIRIDPLTDENVAAFGQTTYSITSRWRATLGLRYTNEHKTVSGTATGAPVDANAATRECNAASLAAGASEDAVSAVSPVGACRFPTVGDKTFTDTSFRAGFEFDLAAKSLLYANVSSAFKAGGFYIGLAPNTYRPEKLTAYQLGSKNSLLADQLLLNLEVFYWDYKDQQISVFQQLNPSQLTSSVPVNVPGHIQGAELETSWLAGRNDLLSADVLYSTGRYGLFPTTVSTNGVVGGLADAPRANLPLWTGTVGYQKTFHWSRGTVQLNLKSHYETATWLSANKIPGSDRPSFHQSDVSLDYHSPSDRWRVSAFVKNLENTAVLYSGTSGSVTPGLLYRPLSNPNAPYAAIGAPRTWGGQVAVRF